MAGVGWSPVFPFRSAARQFVNVGDLRGAEGVLAGANINEHLSKAYVALC